MAVFRRATRPSTHQVHVRRAGSFSEQWALLFRDYLRATPGRGRVRGAEATPGRPLRDDRRGYAAAKEPFSWAVIRRADGWARAQGWQRGPSDA
jgi:GrpB-like predicted nucleotidyltransferase (UPF0157 family)